MPSSAAQASGSPRFYQPELDALRFVAFLGVYLHHKSNPEQILPLVRRLVPGLPRAYDLLNVVHVSGAFGVNLFFLLSSYLITRLIRVEVTRTGRLDLRAFFMRRTLRIWPLYFFFLLLVGVLERLHYATSIAPGFWVAACLFVSNWYVAAIGPTWLPILPIWTVSVEEQFYLLWPQLLRRPSEARVRTVAWATVAVSQLTLLALRLSGVVWDWQISYNTLAQLQFFGLGALVALWAERQPTALSLPRRCGLLLLGLLMFPLSALFDPRAAMTLAPSGAAVVGPLLVNAGPLDYNLLFALSGLGALFCFRAFLGAPVRLFPGWMLALGRLSYGLYLFDLLSGFFARDLCRGRVPILWELPVTLAIDIALALVANRLIERPFLNLKRHWEIVRTREV